MFMKKHSFWGWQRRRRRPAWKQTDDILVWCNKDKQLRCIATWGRPHYSFLVTRPTTHQPTHSTTLQPPRAHNAPLHQISAAELQRFNYFQFTRRPPCWILPEVDFHKSAGAGTHNALTCQISTQAENAPLSW